MSTYLLRITFGVVLIALFASGCGDRFRWSHRIHLTVFLPGIRAITEIESRLDSETLESLEGELPEIWPEEWPPVSMLVPVDVGVLVDHVDLDAIGQDLSGVSEDGFQARLRAVDWSLDRGDLNHPIVDLELWVGEEGSRRPADEDTWIVGHVDALDEGSGELVFAPGGRRVLIDHLTNARSELLVRAVISFDTEERNERPRGGASLSLTFHVDVLK